MYLRPVLKNIEFRRSSRIELSLVVLLLKHFYIFCKRASLGRAALELRATPQLNVFKNWPQEPGESLYALKHWFTSELGVSVTKSWSFLRDCTVNSRKMNL
jgi:hypothetical protein